MEVNLVAEGLKFMVLGMTIVFLFLILLIVAMNVLAKVVQRYFPEPQQPQSGAAKGVDDRAAKLKKVAAIAAAIHHHNRG